MESQMVMSGSKVKTRLGQYATPRAVAQAIAGWAVDGNDPLILDPCFGGCVFIEAAFETLKEAGFEDYLFRVYGIDIDPEAVKSLEPFIEIGAPRHHFLTGDFFDLSRGSLGGTLFSAVIGNPPYVRNHHLEHDLRERAQKAIQADGFWLPRTASYWAYFVLHSLALLRNDGRLGMVLPGAFLRAEYATVVRERVFSGFEQVQIVLVGERVFADAEEEAILVLAEGWGRKNVGVQITRVDGIQDLRELRSTHGTCAATSSDDSSFIISSLLGKDVLAHYHSLFQHPAVTRLRSLVRMSIGVVTGCNDFFIREPSYFLRHLTLKPFARSIVTSSRAFSGIDFTKDDMLALMKEDKSCLLVSLPPRGPLPEDAQRFVREGMERGIDKRTQCAKRTPWYAVTVSDAPDAFLTYMSGYAPRIVVNSARVLSTNTVHHLRLEQPGIGPTAESLAVGALTTPFQLSAELNARSYGGGVLKVEPSEAYRLCVPVPDSTVLSPRLFAEIDSLVRAEGVRTATEMVDDEILVKKMGFSREMLRELRAACDTLRRYRISKKRSNSRHLPPTHDSSEYVSGRSVVGTSRVNCVRASRNYDDNQN